MAPSTTGPDQVSPTRPEMLFYDGECGFCHTSVTWVLHRDLSGRAFRFAPLEGPTFRQSVPRTKRQGLADSLLVLTRDGRLLARSDAAVHILRRLGGIWRAGGALLAAVPRSLRDRAYDAVVRRRHRLGGKPQGACPVLPPALRERFDP